jgi:signal peptidase I
METLQVLLLILLLIVFYWYISDTTPCKDNFEGIRVLPGGKLLLPERPVKTYDDFEIPLPGDNPKIFPGGYYLLEKDNPKIIPYYTPDHFVVDRLTQKMALDQDTFNFDPVLWPRSASSPDDKFLSAS